MFHEQDPKNWVIGIIRGIKGLCFLRSTIEKNMDMSYEESHSGQDNFRNVSQRSDMGNQRIKNDSKKKEKPYFCRNRIVYAISTFP